MGYIIEICPACEEMLYYSSSLAQYQCPACGSIWILDEGTLVRFGDAPPSSTSDRLDEESDPDSVVPSGSLLVLPSEPEHDVLDVGFKDSMFRRRS